MDEHQKQFVKLLEDVSYGHSNVLSDFAEMGALSIYNAVMPRGGAWHEREKRYLQIVKGYKKEQMAKICQMLACIVQSFENGMALSAKAKSSDAVLSSQAMGIRDVLGEIYMDEKVVSRSRWDSDVAFTPWHVSYMMAQMQLADFQLPERGWFRLAEPACGTGGLVIAAAAVINDHTKHNFQRVMHATMVDIRATLAHMAYIQMSLLHIPAVVIHGDSLSGKEWSRWRTPAHILGFWEGRCPVSIAIPKPPEGPKVNKKGQFQMF